MNFRRERIKDYYLKDTSVENIFINEYMADAPGEYVKVYLFALMYADYDLVMSNEIIAKHLGMAEEDVLKSWSYWEKKGIIKKHYEKPADRFHYQVEFLHLKEMVYGKQTRAKAKNNQIPEHLREQMDNDMLRTMYAEIERITGRLFEGKEPDEILSWMTEYNATPEMIVYAYSYCKKKKNNSNYKYVAVVLKDWVDQGLKTIDQIEQFLQETDNRHYLYKRIMRALGFMRNATEEEKRVIDIWFDELGFDITKVLEACKKTTGISNPNINYINSVLKAWSKGETTSVKTGSSSKSGQISEMMKYYEELRIKNESQAETRRGEVYEKLPRIREIEEEVRNVGLDISKIMLSGTPDIKSKVRKLKERVDQLNMEKAYLMTENNFTINYMDIVYQCLACRDTGTLDTGERCSCFTEKLAELQHTT